jgi:hypothetical protein
MEKMPYRGDIQVRPHTAVRRAGSCAVRNPPNDFKLVAVVVDLSSSSGVEDASSADTQRQWDVISMSHRSDLGAEAHPLTVLSKTTWTICCEAA